jgi:Flp pilus assembly protein TadB
MTTTFMERGVVDSCVALLAAPLIVLFLLSACVCVCVCVSVCLCALYLLARETRKGKYEQRLEKFLTQ